MRVDGATNVNLNTLQETNGPHGQVSPAHNTAALAAAEFAEIEAESMNQAIDDLSMGAANYLKKLLSKDQDEVSQVNTLKDMVADLDGEQGESISKMAASLAELGDADAIMAQIESMGMDNGNVMMLLAGVISSAGMSDAVREKLRKKLQELLGEEGAELALIASMEGLPLDQSGLSSLKNLYQRAARGDAGLAKWFSLLKDMPERRKRIRVLLRALSSSLHDDNTGSDMVKLISVIDDLRRLLIFLSIEEHCKALGRACHIEEQGVLTVTLDLVEQSWVYNEWLEDKLNELSVPADKRINFMRLWRELLVQLPDKCFRDPEQQEHITDAMMSLLDLWCEDEE